MAQDDSVTSKPKLTTSQWWRAKEFNREPHEMLDGLIKFIETDQDSRYDAYHEYERMFGSTTTSAYGSDDALGALLREELTQNELENTIETLWAQVFKNVVVPACATSEANYEEWFQAKAYGRWIEGAFAEAQVNVDPIPRAGLDALIYGTGAIKVYWEDDAEDDDLAHVLAERVCPKYLLVDRLEGKHGKPRSLFQKYHTDRFTLFETYKEDRDDYFGTPEARCKGINDCPASDDEDIGISIANLGKLDMCTVREAWHLPSGPKGKDGRHTIWVKGVTLVDEPWDWPVFPFCWIRFGCRIEGFWGESAVKRIAPTQQVLNKLNKKIDESQDIMGVPRIIVRTGANIRKTEIDDIPGGILETDDMNGIRDWNAQCITPELYQERDSLPGKMRALMGISDFEAQQKIPDQMRDVSGAMLERWVDAGTARHAMFHKQYEDLVLQLAEMFMRFGEMLQDMGKEVVVKAPGADMKSSLELLKFSEVMLARKKMKLIIQPMSQLPQTFAGKVDALVKLKELVPINSKTVARMTEIPDIHGQDDLLTSPEEIIMKNLHFMVKYGEYLPPLPFDDLDLIPILTTNFINEYRIRNDANQDRVAMLAQYIDDAIALKGGFGPDPNAPQQIPSTMGALGAPPPAGPPMGIPPAPMPAGPPVQAPVQ